MGNPRWDNNDDKIPIAPYNLNVCKEGSESTNQFYDACAYQNFLWNDNGTIKNIQSLIKSNTKKENNSGISYIGNYLDYVKYLNPVIPCMWRQEDGDISITDSVNLTKESYTKSYITYSSTDKIYTLYKYNDNISDYEQEVISQIPSDNTQAQYIAELYLRGLALGLDKNITPPGLLGMIKCTVDFVVDIGTDETNYTGDVNQFFYGDRYWQIVKDPEETGISQYFETYKDLLGEQLSFPTHLIFTALINPRWLCSDLKIDHLLEPRQVAIVTSNDSTNKNYYKVGSNYFNFGQYYQKDMITTDPGTASDWCHINDDNSLTASDKFLNFTLPVKISYDNKNYYYGNNYSDKYTDETGADKYRSQNNFKFLLHDYLRGAGRDIHTADRFGYVIGF